MSLVISWWIVALVVGGTSPLWIRALTQHWVRAARARAANLVAQGEHGATRDCDSTQPGG